MKTFYRNNRTTIEAVLIFLVLLAMAWASAPHAQDDDPAVKYCVNAETGEVRTVQAGMPCPFPMYEL